MKDKKLEEAIIDALIEGLGNTVKNMRDVRSSWEKLDPSVKQEIQTGVSAVDQVKNNFPKDLAELLTFEIKEDCAIVRPRQFLGSASFAKIAGIVQELKGEYRSAGKESHFRIPVAIEAANEAPDKVTPTEVKTPAAVSEKEFDPEDLMKHEWKGKKIGEGQYAEGSLSWGWDFKDNFKPETIKALECDGSLTIDNYKFTLTEKIVQTQKIKMKK